MKKQDKRYSRPLRPYDKNRIEKEKEIMRTYGLRRKKEIWRAQETLRNFRQRARALAAVKDEKEEKILLAKIHKLGLISADSTLDNILALQIENLLDRRLQTIVVKRKLANTPKQARQFIVHGHIAIDGGRVTWPSAIVKMEEENKVNYYKKDDKLKTWLESTKVEKK